MMFIRRAAVHASMARAALQGSAKMNLHLHSAAQRQLHMQATALLHKSVGISCTGVGPGGAMRIWCGPCVRAFSTGGSGGNSGSSSSGSSDKAGSGGGEDQNARVAYQMGGIAILVFGLAYASVPLYKVFCQVSTWVASLTIFSTFTSLGWPFSWQFRTG